MGDLEDESGSRVFPRQWIALSDVKNSFNTSEKVKSDLTPEAVQNGINTDLSNMTNTSSSYSSVGEDMKRKGFRLATYNILTDNCIREGYYLHCPEQIRYMSSRHGHIMEEIRSMSPDVICIQEADSEHCSTCLMPSMNELGYTGVSTSTTDSQGLAVFWRQNIFRLVTHKSALCGELAQPIVQNSQTLNEEEKVLVTAALHRPEKILTVRLRHLATEEDVVISNVHIAWTELRSPALQAFQISMGLQLLSELTHNSAVLNVGCDLQNEDQDLCVKKNEEIDHMKQTQDGNDQSLSHRCAQIICGDFNTPPHYPGYRMLNGEDITLSSLKLMQDIGLDNYPYQSEIERIKAFKLFDYLPEAYKHDDIKLCSAYKTILGSEPEVTNCDDASEQTGVIRPLCLDYVWFSPQSLDVASVLKTPSKESMLLHHCLPNKLFPSDHIPLSAEFHFK